MRIARVVWPPASLTFFSVSLPIAVGLTLVSLAIAFEPPKDSTYPLPPARTLIRVLVVDVDGHAIPGVSITRVGVSPSLIHSEPSTTITDREGIGTVEYPISGIERDRIESVTVVARHSDYVVAARVCDVQAEDHRIVLVRGATVRVLDDGQAKDRTISFPIVDLHVNPRPVWNNLTDDVCTTNQLPEGRRFLRLASYSDHGAAMFSDVVMIEAQKCRTYEVKMPLRKGLRVEGRLDPSVPRPVRYGRVFADLLHKYEKRIVLRWQTWTTIDEDGQFVFCLPMESEVDLTATCKGFVSRNPPERPYTKVHGTIPQTFNLASNAPIVVAMDPAADCEVALVDEAGKPIDGARVDFGPPVFTALGGSIFGIAWDSKDLLRATSPVTYDEFRKRYLATGFSALTDDKGIARVHDLPAYNQTFVITHSKYELSGNSSLDPAVTTVHLVPSQTTQVSVTMKLKTQKSPNSSGRKALIYDPSADAKADLAAALARAKKQDRRVLVMFGGNWCVWCYRLHDFLETEKEIASIVKSRYEVVLVDVENYADMLKGFGKDNDRHGYPFLTILDDRGQVLANQDTGALEANGSYDVQKVKAFLLKFARAIPDGMGDKQHRDNP